MGGRTVTARELIATVAEAGGTLTLKGDRLAVKAPKPLPTDLVEELRHQKRAILAALAGPPASEEASHLTSEEIDARRLRLTLDTPAGMMRLVPRGDRSPRSAEVPTFTTDEERTLRALPAATRRETFAAAYRAKRYFDPDATVEDVRAAPSTPLDAFEAALDVTAYGSSAAWLGPPARWVRDGSGWACLKPRFAPGEAALFADLTEGDGDLLRGGAIPLTDRLNFLLRAVAEGVLTEEQAQNWAQSLTS